MSEHIYEQRQMDAWHSYTAKGGQVSFESFMARHFRVNEWIVDQMKPTGKFAQMDLIQAGD